MKRWKYKLKNGVQLREAISNEDLEQTVKCLLFCYQELNEKLDAEDREYRWDKIDDALVELQCFEFDEDAEENLNDHLADFYDLCDEIGVWVCNFNEEA